MIPPGQFQGVEKGDLEGQVKFIAQIFGVADKQLRLIRIFCPQ